MANKLTTKKDDGAKKKAARLAVRDILLSLNGQTYAAMKSADQARFVTALGILLDVMDETGKVKAVL